MFEITKYRNMRIQKMGYIKDRPNLPYTFFYINNKHRVYLSFSQMNELLKYSELDNSHLLIIEENTKGRSMTISNVIVILTDDNMRIKKMNGVIRIYDGQLVDKEYFDTIHAISYKSEDEKKCVLAVGMPFDPSLETIPEENVDIIIAKNPETGKLAVLKNEYTDFERYVFVYKKPRILSAKEILLHAKKHQGG